MKTPALRWGFCGIGDRKDERRAADAAVGHEDLRPVDDIVLAVPDGDRLHPARIGAGVGLGQTEGADPLAAGHCREEAAFLLLGAESLDGIDPHAVVDGEAEADRRADAGDLLDGDRVADGVQLRAAIGLRRLEAEKMERSHLLDDLNGKAGVPVDIMGDRTQLGLGKHTHRLADHFMLHAGIEIHFFTPSLLTLLLLSAGRLTGAGRKHTPKIKENQYRSVPL